MSAFYDKMEATARRLIKQFGYSAKLWRAGTPSGPPHNPTPGTPTESACIVVETGYSLTNRDLPGMGTSSLIEVGDKLGIISTEIAGGIVPTKDDVLVVGSDRYNFIDLKPLAPGGQALLFEFHARR